MTAKLSPQARAEALDLLAAGALPRLDFEPEVPCDIRRHAEGAGGCNPEQGASHYVMFSHGATNTGACEPKILAVCLDKAVKIRQKAEQSASCAKCKETGTLRRFVYVIGPIRDQL